MYSNFIKEIQKMCDFYEVIMYNEREFQSK